MAGPQGLRGLEAKHEQRPSQLIRDTRTLGQRVVDFFAQPSMVSVLLGSLAAVVIFMPLFVDIALLIGLFSFLYAITRKATLPFRMPKSAKKMDYNDPPPGSTKPQKSRGICFFGNELSSNEELWFTNEDMRTHVLIFGSTGSGKTEALISLAFNALVQGSGFIYIDGKGDNTLFAKIFSMCRQMGREDDVLVINFMTGAKDIVGAQESRLSNTMNPFANGSSSMLAQLVVSMMESGQSGSPDADMWKGRAIVFIEALMKILVYMRDQGQLLLDANVIRNYFHLDRLEAIVMDKQFIRDKQEPVDISNAPELVIEPITNYLTTLPGYDKSKKGKQSSSVLEQHGFITMQLVRVFGSLADTYSHIIRTNLPEVDMKDIVLNRRILVVLLPALEKSPEELSNLGKIIISTLKAMMAAGLGETLEGSYRDVIERKPTTAPTPFLCIMDEYGYYAVKGFAVVPAQARSLGFSAIFAGQDLPAFQKASKEEAMSIGANTNIKICMKLEDPMETWEFFHKTAGESYVTKVDAFQINPNSITNAYLDTRSSSSEKRARIDLLDLKEQGMGEAHIFFRSKIVRASMFYAAPQPIAHLRLNHFLKVEPVPTRVLQDIWKQFKSFDHILQKAVLFENVETDNEEIDLLIQAMRDSEQADTMLCAIEALKALHSRHVVEQEALVEEEEFVPHNEMHIFTSLREDEALRSAIVTKDIEAFAVPLLDKPTTLQQATVIERALGQTDRRAASIAAEVVKDMQSVTHYPPIVFDMLDSSEIVETIEDLKVKIREAREKKKDNDDDVD